MTAHVSASGSAATIVRRRARLMALFALLVWVVAVAGLNPYAQYLDAWFRALEDTWTSRLLALAAVLVILAVIGAIRRALRPAGTQGTRFTDFTVLVVVASAVGSFLDSRDWYASSCWAQGCDGGLLPGMANFWDLWACLAAAAILAAVTARTLKGVR